MLIPILRYAGRAVALFAVSAVLVSALELFEDQDLITKETEGLIRLAICGTMTLFLASLTVRAPISVSLRSVILLGCAIVTAENLLSYTEDVKSLNAVPLIGKKSDIRRMLEPTLAATWMLTLFYVAYRSITGLRSLYSESLRQERLRAIGEMTSGIAHDLNNALTPLIGSAELLTASIPNPSQEQAGHLWLLQQAAIDLSGIVERVSHFHSVSPGVGRQPASLAALVRESAIGIKPKLKAEQELNGNTIELQLDIVDANVMVCPTEIRAVLTNLLFNSIQAMPDGGKITISNHFRGTTVVIEVTDTGKGMSPDEHKRCQEPFFSTKSAGSGLGLATCRQIIESYGARLILRSEIGKGTTAEFSLPTLKEVPSETEPRSLFDSAGGMRVLFVEDEPAVQNAISMMLHHLGASTECAENGECAIQILTKRNFDLIITDFGLPDVSGADLIRKIRELKPKTKVAVVSGWNSESVAERCHPEAAPDTVLRKPVTIDDLRSLLSDADTSDSQTVKKPLTGSRSPHYHNLQGIGP